MQPAHFDARLASASGTACEISLGTWRRSSADCFDRSFQDSILIQEDLWKYAANRRHSRCRPPPFHEFTDPEESWGKWKYSQTLNREIGTLNHRRRCAYPPRYGLKGAEILEHDAVVVFDAIDELRRNWGVNLFGVLIAKTAIQLRGLARLELRKVEFLENRNRKGKKARESSEPADLAESAPSSLQSTGRRRRSSRGSRDCTWRDSPRSNLQIGAMGYRRRDRWVVSSSFPLTRRAPLRSDPPKRTRFREFTFGRAPDKKFQPRVPRGWLL